MYDNQKENEKAKKDESFLIPQKNNHNFQTFYDNKINFLNVSRDTEQKQKKNDDIFEEKAEVFKINPEMQKFKIEGFNLNSITKPKKAKFEEDFQENKKKLQENFYDNSRKNALLIENVKMENFAPIFHKTLKNVISLYKNEIDYGVSQYIFNKLAFLEYVQCFK